MVAQDWRPSLLLHFCHRLPLPPPPPFVVSQAGSDAFVPMKNAFGAAFEASRLPALPWDIKLTNADGKSIVLS